MYYPKNFLRKRNVQINKAFFFLLCKTHMRKKLHPTPPPPPHPGGRAMSARVGRVCARVPVHAPYIMGGWSGGAGVITVPRPIMGKGARRPHQYPSPSSEGISQSAPQNGSLGDTLCGRGRQAPAYTLTPSWAPSPPPPSASNP